MECDLLILKQDSKAIFEAPEIYRAEDVITIIESKATGIFIDKKKPKNPFLNELCMVKQLNDKGKDQSIQMLPNRGRCQRLSENHVLRRHGT